MKSVFKIRRKSDGLFSRGGSFPSFGKTGKSWSKNALHQHLSLTESMKKYYGTDYVEARYKDCEVVEFVVSEGPAIPVLEYNEKRKRK